MHAEKAQTYLLGVDGGGTNARAVIADAAGRALGEGRAEAANLVRVGLATAVANVEKAVAEACANAGLSVAQITTACFGLAGVGNAKHHAAMLAALQNAFPRAAIKLETDARIALAGATDLQPGVVIIAGTGSISCGINAAGEFARAGGWGPIMGDEGSGAYIGRRALEAVVMAYDHRGAPTQMTAAVLQQFGVSAPPELPPVIYDASPEERQLVQQKIAQLSRVAVQCAQAGDWVATQILQDAALELARAATAVISQLGLANQRFHIAYVGGVFEAGELMLAPLRAEIQRTAPQAELAPPLYSPAVGAVKLAQRQALS
jgi:N-acetylglucosamine kinase-like BadF-type ATPase